MRKNVSKALCLLLVSSLAIISFSVLLKSAYGETQVLTGGRHEGDLILRENDYASLINDNMTIVGSVIIEENATLYLENSTLLVEQTTDSRYNITLRNPLGGQPKIVAKRSTIDRVSNTNPIIIYSYSSLVTAANCTIPSILLFSGSSLVAAGKYSQLESVRAADSAVQLTNVTGTLQIQRVILDHSDATILGTEIGTLSARNYSNVTYSGGEIRTSLIAFDNATVAMKYARISSVDATSAVLSMTNTTTNKLEVRGSSSLTAVDCVPPHIIVQLNLYDNTSAILSNSMVTSLSTYNSSRLTLTKTMIGGPTSFFHIEGNSTVAAHDSRLDYPTLTDNARVTFSNITSSNLAIEKNATLNASKLNIGQSTFVMGNAQVRVANSTLRGLIGIQDSAIATFSNSGLNITDIRDASSASIVASSVGTLRVLDSSKAEISNSYVKDLHIQALSINGTFAGFKEESLVYWNFVSNNSITFLYSNSGAPDLTLRNMQAPQNVTLQVFGNSNITISNTKLSRVDAMDKSMVTLVNVTLDSYGVGGSAIVYSYWYLHIRVVNLQNAPVDNAKIIILAPSGEIIESGATDSNGWFRSDKKIFANVINGTKVERSLVLEVRKDDSLIRKLTAEFASGYINLKFAVQTQWWQQYWYLIVMIAMLAVSIILVFIRRR